MRISSLSKGPLLPDFDLDGAALDRVEQGLGAGFEVAAGGGVSEQVARVRNSDPFAASKLTSSGSGLPDALPKPTSIPRGLKQSRESMKVDLPTES